MNKIKISNKKGYKKAKKECDEWRKEEEKKEDKRLYNMLTNDSKPLYCVNHKNTLKGKKKVRSYFKWILYKLRLYNFKLTKDNLND